MKKPVLLIAFFAVLSLNAFADQTPKDKWAKFGDVKIHFYDIGRSNKKDALILVHGWNCNADFWKESFNAFPNYRVVAIDLPGSGQSDKPKVEYSMEYFARSIDAVMRQAKIERAVLVGHSMGTPVIRQFYRIFPQKTLGLVIVDGALKPFAPRPQMEQFLAPLRANYKEGSAKFVDDMLTPIQNAELKTRIRTTMLAAPEYVGLGAWDGMIDDRIWIDDQIKVPTLAILAAGPWPADIETTYRTVAPDLEFQMWSGVSHFLMMERPKEFNAAVAKFLVNKRLL
ncbi:MAG TPA: alpha/beta hydrolase [Pyrinomonadaceae bacterium]|nr:alpha/beta hydrolase [Pyrinomonadaceae bacterium]